LDHRNSYTPYPYTLKTLESPKNVHHMI